MSARSAADVEMYAERHSTPIRAEVSAADVEALRRVTISVTGPNDDYNVAARDALARLAETIGARVPGKYKMVPIKESGAPDLRPHVAELEAALEAALRSVLAAIDPREHRSAEQQIAIAEARRVLGAGR